MEFFVGRPLNCSDRLDKEVAVYDILDELGVEFTRVDHDALMTIDDCVSVGEKLGVNICKNLFLCNSGRTQFYLLLMPGNKKFVTKEVSKQIGSSRLSFASDVYMLDLLNITPGSVSVFGLMNDKEKRVKLLIDRDVLNEKFFGCHPCINTSSIKLKTQDVIEKFLPHINREFTIVDL